MRVSRSQLLLVALSAGFAACGLLSGIGDLQRAVDSPPDGAVPIAPGDEVTMAGDASVDAPSPCGEGGVTCGSACVDTMTDPANCGACGVGCKAASCFRGTCGGKQPIEVAAGLNHGCVLLRYGGLSCFGANDNFALGRTKVAPGECGAACDPTPALVPGLGPIEHVSAGGGFTCAIDRTGGVFCWGINGNGQLGHPGSQDSQSCLKAPCSSTPTRVAGLPPAVAISAGNPFACALVKGGDAYCWGDNGAGELGDGTRTASAAPVKVAAPKGVHFKTIATSFNSAHTCAATPLGDVYCWGDNYVAGLGHAVGSSGDIDCGGGRSCNPNPVQVAGDWNGAPFSGVVSIASLDAATCAVKKDGSVYCWGYSAEGTLGTDRGLQGHVSAPLLVPAISKVIQVSGSFEHACAVGSSYIACWGNSNVGQVGNGAFTGASSCFPSTPCDPVPMLAGGGATWSAVSAGGSFTLGLALDGGVFGWGTNANGQLAHAPGKGGDVDAGGSAASAVPENLGF